MTDEKLHCAWLSDADSQGSGYRNLSVEFCNGLVERGLDVKVIGLHYQGDEHFGSYSLIPAEDFRDAFLILSNLVQLWRVDVLIVALDINLQEQILRMVGEQRPFKYIGIMPIESDPLCVSWAMALTMMDKACIISHFGVEEAKKVGVFNAEYLEIGVDTDFWKPISEEEIKNAKNALGLNDCFTVLTVADNQERKNLSAAMKAFSLFAKDHPEDNLKYVMVTREHNLVGWRLRDLASEYGINDKFMVIERGVDREQLRKIYACSDVFVLSSKCEGLGMPLLEAMAMEKICVATNCTGMKELLSDDRGMLIDYYDFDGEPPRDPFGNGRRYWIDILKLKTKLSYLYNILKDIHNITVLKKTKKAHKFVKARDWSIGKDKLAQIIMEICKDVKTEEKAV